MVDTRRLGVGIAGLGIGEQHALAFQSLPNCHVRALHDLDAARARVLAPRFPDATVAASFEEMLDRPDIDIVSIATYDDVHFEQVMKALSAGKHVFVEKPLCRTFAELGQLKRAWSEAGGRLKLHSNLILRAAPLYRWLRAQIGAGRLGKLYAFDGDYLYGRMQKITEGWRNNVTDYSVMEGGGVHLIDLLLWLTGERPSTVAATGSRICSAGTSFRYDDYMAATLSFDSGLIARISANFGCVHRHQHVVKAYGTEATLIYDDSGARLHTSRDPAHSPGEVRESALPASKGDLIPDFVAAILENSDDSAATQAFFDGISVCVAADRSCKSGNKEKVEYV